MAFRMETVDTIIKSLDELKNKDQFTKSVLKDLQEIFLKEIHKKAPRNTGKYSESWKAGTVTPKKATVETPEGELYEILEFTGRKPGRINAKAGGVLAFKWRNADVFFKFVNHPGFDEMPHVRPALRVTMKQTQTVINKNLKKHFKLFK